MRSNRSVLLYSMLAALFLAIMTAMLEYPWQVCSSLLAMSVLCELQWSAI